MKKNVLKTAAAAVLLALCLFIPEESVLRLPAFILVWLIPGVDLGLLAYKSVLEKKYIDDSIIIILASFLAFCVKDFSAGAAIAVVYGIGTLILSYTADNSRESVTDYIDIRPITANLSNYGEISKVDPRDIVPDSVVLVRPGEKVPLDGVIIEGSSTVDTSALTADSVTFHVSEGDSVYGGYVNLGGTINVRVTRAYDDCAISKMIELLDSSQAHKSGIEKLTEQITRYFKPAVIVMALLICTLPPIFLNGAKFSDWLTRGVVFLAASCPVSLIAGAGLTYKSGVGAALKCGILVKGNDRLDSLSHVDTVAFGKTGTLTKGVYTVTEALADYGTETELLELAASASYGSEHPVSLAIIKAGGGGTAVPSETFYIPGEGIGASFDGRRVLVGNSKLMERAGIYFPEVQSAGTINYVAADSRYIGYIIVADEIREDSLRAVHELKMRFKCHTVLMTGDSAEAAGLVSRRLGIDEFCAEIQPDEKVRQIKLLKNEMRAGASLVFVGDGVGDADALTAADVGVAVHGLSSPDVMSNDIVIMDEKPSKVVTAMRIAKKTSLTALIAAGAALFLKALVFILGAAGVLGIWPAVLIELMAAVLTSVLVFRALGVNEFN